MTLVLQWARPPSRFRLIWAGPAAAVVTVPRRSCGMTQIAVVIGPPGARGPAGDVSPAASLVVENDVAAGCPLAINRATGRLVAADAAVFPIAFVIGLAAADTRSGFVADATGAGNVTLPDWSAVTGTSLLAPGQSYFLARGGGLSTVPPSAGALVLVGEAMSPTTLNLRHTAPILL